MQSKYLWFVDWENLEAAFTSFENARQYVKNEAERMKATFKEIVNLKYCRHYKITYPSGFEEEILIYQIRLDPKNSIED